MGEYGKWTGRHSGRDEVELKQRGVRGTTRGVHRVMVEYHADRPADKEIYDLLEEMMQARISIESSVRDDVSDLIRTLYGLYKKSRK